MKILVIQITRLGDILCTVPVLSALKRAHPGCELHLVARKKWAACVKGLPFVDRVHELDAEAVLGPIILTQDPRSGLGPLGSFVDALRAEAYDAVYNLSFSPASSFLTHMVAGPSAAVGGYTRTSDGYLEIRDEASLYFRAQAGVDGFNRLHVVDLFAWVAGVVLRPEDWTVGEGKPRGFDLAPGSYAVVHLGASQGAKTWPLAAWQRCLSELARRTDLDFVLVGSGAGEARACAQTASLEPLRFKDWSGRTDVRELAWIARRSRLFIGADSGPMQVANAAGARILNLSVGPVRFWETGPTVPGSVVLAERDPRALDAARVVDAALRLAEGKGCDGVPGARVARPDPSPTRYGEAPGRRDEEGWETILWMHFGGPRPAWLGRFPELLARAREVCGIALGQLESLLAHPGSRLHIEIIEQADGILRIIGAQPTPLRPLFRRFAAEKENIGPGDLAWIVARNQTIYQTLARRASEGFAPGAEGAASRGHAPERAVP